MSFITFEKGSKAKILRKGDYYYNQDYYPVIHQNKTTGQVMLQLPSGRRKIYEADELKKYVAGPSITPLPASQDNEEKSDDHKAMTDFFFPKNKQQRTCPICGQSGHAGFREFSCSNPDCENNQ